MKEILLIFNGLGYQNINQAIIKIYDLNGNLVCQDKTYNGRLKVCLKEKRFYKVLAISKYEAIKKVIYVNQDTIIIPFSNSLVLNRSVTFYLTDYSYPKLPIEKGTIILG